MKKYNYHSITAVIALVISLLPGCRKAIDFLEDNPTAAFCPCRIAQFGYTGLFGTDTVTFTYNSAGDPVTGIRVHPGTGNPNFFFRYDQRGRFTDLIGGFGQTTFDRGVESWDRYFYDGRGRIVKDSAYFFPGIVNGNPTIDSRLLTSVEINTYEYDTKNRVSEQTVVFSPGFSLVNSYSYNADGNLAGHYYDDKINYHRTNRVWMFIDRDYSVNNPVIATYEYNDFGLPTRIVPFEGTAGSFAAAAHTRYEYVDADIRYSCLGKL